MRRLICLFTFDGIVLQLAIIETDKITGRGLWNVDSNVIIVTSELFDQYESVSQNKTKLRLFFDNLQKVSQEQLPEPLKQLHA